MARPTKRDWGIWRLKARRFLVTLLLVGAWGSQAQARQVPAKALPAAAQAAGFTTKTLETTDFSAATVDMSKTLARGYHWYLWNFFGGSVVPADITFPGGGTISVGAGNGAIASGAIAPGRPGFVGRAFGGGGYFEAEFRFKLAVGDTGAGGWPSWWAMSAEHMWQLPGKDWPGQVPGYEHFIEIDAFEKFGVAPSSPDYLTTVHDWYGTFRGTCGKERVFCKASTRYKDNVVTLPKGANWNNWHRVGMLWIPASAKRHGQISFWLDGKRVGQIVRYDRYVDQVPPVTITDRWAFSFVDRQHLVLLFGSSAASPLQVRRVTVWQADATKNLTN